MSARGDPAWSEGAGERPADQGAVPDAAQERALDFVHQAALQHVVMADRKAGILFTLLSAALLFLFTRMPDWGGPVTAATALWLAATALLIAAATLAFLVVLPRVRSDGAPGVLFWGAIARHAGPDAYLRSVCGQTPAEIGRGKARYCYELSCICARKFRLLRVALLLGAAGMVLFLVMLAAAGAGRASLPPLG